MTTKLAAIWNAVKNSLLATWQKCSAWVIALGVLIVYLSWQQILIAWNAFFAKKEMQIAKKEDQTLAIQQAADNTQADALVKQAQQLPSQETPVADDWYLKDKK